MNRLNKILENENKIKEIVDDIDKIFINAQGGEEPEFDDEYYEEEYQRMCSDPNYQASSLESEKKKLLIENRKLRAEIDQKELDKSFEILSKTFKSGLVATDNKCTQDTLSRYICKNIGEAYC